MDHVRSVGALAKRTGASVFMSRTTRELVADKLDGCEVTEVTPLKRFSVGGFEVIPFPLPHDAAQTLGYRVESQGMCMAVATDIGSLTPLVAEHMRGCNVLVLEANYDYDMLVGGPYPAHLKQRILSKMGHFSNEDCLNALKELVTARTATVILAHLSEENNDPYLAAKTISEGLCGRVKVLVAYPRNKCETVVLD